MIKSTRQRPTALQLLCVPIVRDRAAELGLSPLMPSQKFPTLMGAANEEAAARAPKTRISIMSANNFQPGAELLPAEPRGAAGAALGRPRRL